MKKFDKPPVLKKSDILKKFDNPPGPKVFCLPHLNPPWWRAAAWARCASLPRAPFYYTRVRPQCDFSILGRVSTSRAKRTGELRSHGELRSQATGRLFSNLPHPRVNKTKQHTLRIPHVTTCHKNWLTETGDMDILPVTLLPWWLLLQTWSCPYVSLYSSMCDWWLQLDWGVYSGGDSQGLPGWIK